MSCYYRNISCMNESMTNVNLAFMLQLELPVLLEEKNPARFKHSTALSSRELINTFLIQGFFAPEAMSTPYKTLVM